MVNPHSSPDNRGTWLSNKTSGYAPTIAASDSQQDMTTESKSGFDPDAHALPILTEQETRQMGLNTRNDDDGTAL